MKSNITFISRSSIQLVLMVVLAGVLVRAQPSVAQSELPFVISEIYARGGEPGSSYPYDFVEFRHAETYNYEDIFSVQYASGKGTDTIGQDNIQMIPVRTPYNSAYSVSRIPFDESGLPTSDEEFFNQQAGYNIYYAYPHAGGLYDDGGKIAIVRGYEPLGCNGGTVPCTEAQKNRIIDIVGYGDTDLFEGSSAPAPGNTEVIYRKGGANTVDTNDNSGDFAIGMPLQRFHFYHAYITSVAAASPPSTFVGESTLLTIAIKPTLNPPSTGVTVYGNLSVIGGSALQPFFDDGTHGDVVAGDHIFSYRATMRGIDIGRNELYTWIFDAEGRSNAYRVESVDEITEWTFPYSAIDFGVGQPLGSGTATPHVVAPGGSTLLTIDVTRTARGTYENIDARCDLEPITGIPDGAYTPLVDDGKLGDIVAGDHRFSLLTTVDQDIAEGFVDIKCLVTQLVPVDGRNVTTSFRPHIALTVGENVDPQPPTGTITIEKLGASDIDVHIDAKDDVSHAEQVWMRLSTQPQFMDTTWQPYKLGAVVPRTHAGSAHVYVQFEDAAGNRSEIECAGLAGKPCADLDPFKVYLPFVRTIHESAGSR